jgi:hypothetical protein
LPAGSFPIEVGAPRTAETLTVASSALLRTRGPVRT